MSDEPLQPEGMEYIEVIVDGKVEKRLVPKYPGLMAGSIPGIHEVDEDGDLLLYISPRLLRLRAQHEAEANAR